MTETLTVNQVAPITSVPQGWQRLPLRRLFRITGGATPKSDVAEYWGGDIDWVTPADLGKTPSLEVHNSARTLTRAGLDSCAAELLPPGSIIVSVRAPIGAIGIAKVPMATNQGCKGLVGQSAEPRFMAYQLSVSQASLEAVGRGTTFTELSATDLGSFQVAVPPPDLQRTIANFLDRETDKIDALIDKQEQLIATLREDRAATIAHAVTKGLNPDVEMKDSGVERLGHIPTHWTVPQIGWHSRVGNGSTPARDNQEYWLNGLVPWLNSGHVNRDRITDADQFVTNSAVLECHLPMVPAGSVLVGLTGQGKTRGMASLLMVPSTINQHLAYVTPISRQIGAAYLCYAIRSSYDYLREISEENGSTKGGLTCSALKKLRIPIPPKNEQDMLVRFLDERCSKIDSLIAKSTEMIDTLREYRSALITNAVTGKIDVREAV